MKQKNTYLYIYSFPYRALNAICYTLLVASLVLYPLTSLSSTRITKRVTKTLVTRPKINKPFKPKIIDTASTRRTNLPWQIQFSPDLFIPLLGFSIGYHIDNIFFVGVKISGLIEYDYKKRPKYIAQTTDGINTYSLSTKVNQKLSLSMPYQEIYLNIHPFEDSAFYTKVGILYRKWKANLSLKSSTVTLAKCPNGATTCTIPASVRIPRPGDKLAQISVKWPSFGMDFGIGWNWIKKSGLSGGAEIGMWTGAAPYITSEDFYKDLEWVNDDSLNNLYATRDNISNKLKSFANIPHLSVGIGYNFNVGSRGIKRKKYKYK